MDVKREGVKGCGSSLAYPFFIAFIFIVPLITMNLFIAVVIQGYELSLREYEAELLPRHIDDLVEKWAEYDPNATGFITPYNFAFLLHELPPPVGLKDEKFQYEYNQKTTPQHLISPNKKIALTQQQIFKVISNYNLILYSNRMMHFKDIYLCISHLAICKRHNLTKLAINQSNVITQLNGSWYTIFPSLKRNKLDNKNQQNFTAL